MNYTLNEYASDVVYRIGSVCNARNIPHPLIISESGRAIAAHHSVLIFNVLGRSALDRFRSRRPRRRRVRRRSRRCRSRCATCSTPIATSMSAGWSSAITMRSRRATRRCRCSTSACCRWNSAA